VTNRQTDDQKMVQDIPMPEARWDQFTNAVTLDGKLILSNFEKNYLSELAAWLRTSPAALRELDVRGDGRKNVIEPEGAKALAEALQVNTTLRTLDLSWNKIGVAGAKALAIALKFNTTVTELYLDNNDIGVDGVKALADALQSNKTLSSLELRITSYRSESEWIDIKELRRKIDDLLEKNRQREKNLSYAPASLGLLVRHSPKLNNMEVPREIMPVIAKHLSDEVMGVLAQEVTNTFRAPPPPVTTRTTNATTNTTTTTTTTTDATKPTILTTSPVALTTDPSSSLPSMTESTATEATINALLAAPSPDVALLRWIDGHVNPAATLNWVDPTNGYTLLHYAVKAQQIAVIRSLLIRGIDRQKADYNNQNASQLAQARADSSSSGVAADIAALLRRVENNRGYL
jgi:hypothetical protein